MATKPVDVERAIAKRFMELASKDIGPGRRWAYRRDFAKDMGMVSQQVHKIEKFGTHLQFHQLVRFHELTGADLHYIILGKKVKPKNKRVITLLQEVIKELKG